MNGLGQETNVTFNGRKITILAIFVTMLWAGQANADEFTFDYQKIIDGLERPITLSLDYVNGDIIIEQSRNDLLIIEAVKTVYASNRDEAERVADHIEISVKQNGDKISIKSNYLKMLNRSTGFWNRILGRGSDSYGDVDFRISVPIKCDLIIQNNSGSIDISNHEGSVSIISNVNTRITIRENQGSVTIVSEAADIELSSIEGQIDISNTAGKMIGEFLFGDVRVKQPKGQITLKWVEGDIKVRSETGRIIIKQLRGAIDLTTRSATVEIQTELVSHKGYFVETSSGRILFSVPFSASGLVDIETRSGEIKSEVPIIVNSMTKNKLSGKFGGGGARIVLTSSTGDVTVAQY